MAVAVQWVGSVHRTKDRNGYRPEAVVIHIMEGTLAGTDAWFNDPTSHVSAHYGVGRAGEIHQYVEEANTAYHAGRVKEATWSRIKLGVNPNYYTIGIEHEGNADSIWSETQYGASASLLSAICGRWSIPLDRDHVIGHREIYGPKTCPGHRVDLNRLIEEARNTGSNGSSLYPLIALAGTVQSRTNLNIRRGMPSASVQKAWAAAPGEALAHVAYTRVGEMVLGNSSWYRNQDGDFFWAGGTDRPDPG
jgi:N-acetylmuramoyl-L-alanine amidase